MYLPQFLSRTRGRPLYVFITCFLIGIVTWNFLKNHHQFHQFGTVLRVPEAKKEDWQFVNELARKEVVLISDQKIPGDSCESNGLTALKVFNGEYENVHIGSQQKLLGYIKKCHLIPPSKLPYNLADPTGDPSVEEGVRKYVQDELLGGMKNGKFVDAGANDGEFISNTLVLERDYGWTGLLIEADPEVAKRLLNKRRKSWVANVCAGIQPYPYKTKMNRRISNSTEFPARVIQVFQALGRLDSSHRFEPGPNWSSFEVRCLPLFLMMKALNLTHIDYLSMDIEGVELGVLKTLPFDQMFVKVFSVETQPNTWTPIREFMKSKGYYFIREIRNDLVEDDIFIHESLLKNVKKHA